MGRLYQALRQSVTVTEAGQQSKMNSTKVSWIVFEEENTKTSQPSLDGRSSVSSLDNFDHFSFDLSDSGDSRYSVFDNLRQRERNGEYLGWSSDILGEGQSGWSDGLRRKSL